MADNTLIIQHDEVVAILLQLKKTIIMLWEEEG